MVLIGFQNTLSPGNIVLLYSVLCIGNICAIIYFYTTICKKLVLSDNISYNRIDIFAAISVHLGPNLCDYLESYILFLFCTFVTRDWFYFNYYLFRQTGIFACFQVICQGPKSVYRQQRNDTFRMTGNPQCTASSYWVEAVAALLY